ncbi:MAG: Xaa-Pro peptidase family protein [Candidatus Aenigmatarchaeota archaeon]
MVVYRARQRKLAGGGSFLITDKKDVLYYTGFLPSSTSFLLITKSRTRLFVSSLDNEAVKARAETSFYRDAKDIAATLKGRVGLDYDMPAAVLLRLRRLAKKAKFYDGTAKIKQPRAIKDGWEIGKIKEAVRLASGIQDSIDMWDKTERKVAEEIEIALLEAGTRKAFDPIVSSGLATQYIHTTPRETVIRDSPVLIDMGAVVSGYHSDRTRMFLKNPTPRQKSMLEDVKEMQGQIIDFISPGKTFKEIQEFWENLMVKKGYGVMHSFGHGVGLDVHDPLNTIANGSVLTVEPGIYSQRHGGFRVEDIVAVRAGKAKILA